MKTCPKCKETKPFEAFSRQTKSKDGRYPYCKECARVKVRAMYRARGKRSWMEDKTCSWCRVLKPRTEFRKTNDGKVVSRCLVCEAEIAAKEALNLRRCNLCREWLPFEAFHASKLRFPNIACRGCARTQMTQPAYRVRQRAYLLMKEYGITLEQYDELVVKQGGNCPVCLEPLPTDRSGHVDHAHSGPFKGRIRAIVHGHCNRTILHDHEDSAILRRAADLIDNPLTDWMVPGLPSSEVRKEARKQRKLK